MDKGNTQNKFDEYLLKIEQREKALQRKNNFKLIGVVVLMISSFFGYQQLNETKGKIDQYALESLSPEKVNELFTEKQKPIIVYHPEIGHDTVSSINDYYQVLNTLDLIEMGRKAYMMSAENKSLDTTGSVNPLDRYVVDVAGERSVGRKLIFTIEDYNDSLNYELDLGNGVVKPIKKTVVYRYPLPGHFDMKLTASDREGHTSTYIKKYEIIDPVQTASYRPEKKEDNKSQTEAIAENAGL
ncbi:MAG: PKD domain-containing protein [Bacteroidetes bacterium]|nr:PKD domain-containing protein [Bacteroidota bacterium]